MRGPWVILLALGGVLPLRGLAQDTSIPPTRAAFDSLKARLEAGDTAIDYRALRMAFTATPDYDPFGTMRDELRGRMMEAHFRAQDPVAALAAADSFLATNYVDIDAHVIAALASAVLGDSARTRFHQAVARGLVDSIARPGEGTTADTPYEVIGISEEYALLRVWGWRREAQALTECRGQPCDRLEVVDVATGESHVVYFDVSRERAFFDRERKP